VDTDKDHTGDSETDPVCYGSSTDGTDDGADREETGDGTLPGRGENAILSEPLLVIVGTEQPRSLRVSPSAGYLSALPSVEVRAHSQDDTCERLEQTQDQRLVVGRASSSHVG
jgi:hypothetical protein